MVSEKREGKSKEATGKGKSSGRKRLMQPNREAPAAEKRLKQPTGDRTLKRPKNSDR